MPGSPDPDDGQGDCSKLFGTSSPVSIRANAFRGPVSRSLRPQPPSLSPKEPNTYDDMSIDQSDDVFKVKTAEGSDATPSTSLTGRKRKTEVTSTSSTNREEKQYTPYDQSAKTRNLSLTAQDEQKEKSCQKYKKGHF